MRHGTNIRGLGEFLEWLPVIEPIKMVEVGSCAGDSAKIFASSSKVKEIHCVDSWLGDWAIREQEFDLTMKPFGDMVFKHKMESEKGSQLFENDSLDMVYLDADHTYDDVKRDINLWRPKVKSGGFLSGHDFSFKFLDLIIAVGEIFGKPEHVFCDASWVVRIH